MCCDLRGGGDFLQEFYSKLTILMVQYIQKMDPVEHKLFFGKWME